MLPTPQLVRRGEDLTFTSPMEAGMVGGFLWFSGNLCPVFGSIQVLVTG